MKEISFTYCDIINTKPDKDGDLIYAMPRFIADTHSTYDASMSLQDFNNDGWTIGMFYGEIKGKGFLINGSNYDKFGVWIKLEYDRYTIIETLKQEKALLTFKPTAKEKKAIKIALEYAGDRAEHWLVSQIAFGFGDIKKLLAINIVGEHINVFWDGEHYRGDINKLKELKEILLPITGKVIAKEIKRSNYKDLVKACISNGKSIADKQFNRDIKAYKDQVASYVSGIKQQKITYIQTKDALKKVEESRKVIPKELMDLIDKQLSVGKGVIKTVNEYAAACKANINKQIEVTKEKDYFSSQAKKIGDDLNSVRRLLKNGTIESIDYVTNEGLRWVYGPMIYRPYAADPKYAVFLGKVEVILRNNSKLIDRIGNHSVFSFRFKSYGEDMSIGTWHVQNFKTGERYCTGEFENMLNKIVKSGRIYDLILCCKSYLQSVNEGSKYFRPTWSNMEMSGTGPKVIDKSFIEYVKKNEKQLETVAVITESNKEYELDQIEEELDGDGN